MLVDPRRPYNTRALIDACKPFDRIRDFPRVAQASPALLRGLRDRWAKEFADPRFPLAEGAIGGGSDDKDASPGSSGGMSG
jgi:hypothetical protein